MVKHAAAALMRCVALRCVALRDKNSRQSPDIPRAESSERLLGRAHLLPQARRMSMDDS